MGPLQEQVLFTSEPLSPHPLEMFETGLPPWSPGWSGMSGSPLASDSWLLSLQVCDTTMPAFLDTGTFFGALDDLALSMVPMLVLNLW